MPIKLVSLNVGRLLSERTEQNLRSLADKTFVPDVVVLQDMPFRSLPLLERWPHIAFGVMTNHLINGVRTPVGIAIASGYFITDVTHHTYWGNGVFKNLQGVNDKNERHLGELSDRMVEESEDRLVVCATIVKLGVKYHIATTHGMWVRGGVPNDVQRSSMRRLLEILVSEAAVRGSLVLAGDMNFNRGGEIYQMFTEKLHDCVPPEIKSTLDPDHPASKKGVQVVSDYLLTIGRGYVVSDVHLEFGVSDHAALTATVSKD